MTQGHLCRKVVDLDALPLNCPAQSNGLRNTIVMQSIEVVIHF